MSIPKNHQVFKRSPKRLTQCNSSLANQLNSNYTSAWYGTFKLAPDEPDPTPNGPLYAPSIYNTYDPNWR